MKVEFLAVVALAGSVFAIPVRQRAPAKLEVVSFAYSIAAETASATETATATLLAVTEIADFRYLERRQVPPEVPAATAVATETATGTAVPFESDLPLFPPAVVPVPILPDPPAPEADPVPGILARRQLDAVLESATAAATVTVEAVTETAAPVIPLLPIVPPERRQIPAPFLDIIAPESETAVSTATATAAPELRRRQDAIVPAIIGDYVTSTIDASATATATAAFDLERRQVSPAVLSALLSMLSAREAATAAAIATPNSISTTTVTVFATPTATAVADPDDVDDADDDFDRLFRRQEVTATAEATETATATETVGIVATAIAAPPLVAPVATAVPVEPILAAPVEPIPAILRKRSVVNA